MNLRQRLGHRGTVVLASVVGFAAGGAGLVAAGQAVFTTADDPVTTVSAPSSESTDVSVPVTELSIPTSVDDSTATSVDDSTESSTPNSVEDGDDDSSSSSVPNSSGSSTPSSTPGSTPAAMPPAFTETYQSSGGSITVTWDGSAFHLDSVNPAAGFSYEVKDLRWDRVRVDFEGDRDDARIEVRLSDDDNTIRVRID